MPLAAQISELLNKEAAAGAFSGVVVLRRDGKVIYEGAFGYANRPFEVPNRLETRFRLASLSKLFTAIAVLRQVELGALKLDDSIHKHVDLRGSKIPPTVTIAHLLSMSSGIADWFEESEDWEAAWEAVRSRIPPDRLRRNEDYLPLFIHKPPLTQPGATVAYSNAGFILLGLAVQSASGMDYYDCIRERIFAPAGMGASNFAPLDRVSPLTAEGYVPIEEEAGKVVAWERNIYRVPVGAAADGSATSSAGDLLALLDALRGGSLLTPEGVSALFAPRLREHEELIRGYRWMRGYAGSSLLNPGTGVVVRWGVTGEEDGVSCRLYVYPAMEIDLVILGNQSWCAGKLGWALHDLIVNVRL